MPLVSSSIPNLINGVSQQPAPTRLRTSCEDADNAYMSVVSGLQKRPQSDFVVELPSLQATTSDTAVHVVKKSSTNKFVIVATNGAIQVFDLETGVTKPVTMTASSSYLNSSDPASDFRFVTVADTTFILNRSVTVLGQNVAEDGSRLDPSTRCTVTIKRAVASTDYKIFENGGLISIMTTQDNTTAATALEGTAEIAEALRVSLAANGRSDAEVIGSSVTWTANVGTTVTVLDQFGGNAMRVIRDSVQEFSDLPPQEKVGRLVRVVGDADSTGDDYFVRFNGNVWEEVVGYNQGRRLNATTMPHKLVDNGSSFEFTTFTWPERTCGDADSNPQPTFVGNTINHLFLYKARLGFLSDENLIMSETSNYENFFRNTVAQVLDTDRIDVASNTGRVNVLLHAAAFGNNLVLFSDKQQFKVTQGDTLTPSTVGLQPTTTYDNSTRVAPVNSGANVFFAVDGTNFALIRELYIDSDNDQFDAVEVTVQVPKYIPTNIAHLAVSTYEDVLVAVSANERNAMYVYKWFMDGKTRVQSSWSRWVVDAGKEIIGLDFIDQDMIIVYRQNTKVYVDRLRVEETVGVQSEVPLLLDSKVTTQDCNRVYNPTTDTTTITIPYSSTSTLEFWRGSSPYGEQLTATKIANNTYTIAGNEVDTDWAAGFGYNFRFTFSEQYNRAATEGGEVAVQDGRLQLRYMSVIYQNSSFFNAEVTPKNRDARTYSFNGRVFSDSENVLDTMPFDTGEFRFPVTAQNNAVTIRLTSDKPFPCAFGSAEWDAMYYPRTQRI